MSLKRRVITTAGVTTAITFLLGVGSFVIAGMISKSSDGIIAAQRKIDEQYALRRSLRGSTTDLSSIKREIGRLSVKDIHEGGELDFVRALEAAADTTGVSQDIRLETVNQKEISGWEKEVPLNLTFTGTYPQIIRHIAEIESLPYAVTVQNVTVNSESDPLSRKVRASLAGSIRWIGQNAPDYVAGRDDGMKTP